MPTIAPWLHGYDWASVISDAISQGQRARQLTDNEREASTADKRRAEAQQFDEAEAGRRLRLSYDQLSQQERERKAALAVQQQRFQAADALRQSQQNSTDLYRIGQLGLGRDRLAQAASKTDAASKLRDSMNADIVGFYKDAKGGDIAGALAKHPLAANEPGIRSAAAQVLINPKSKSPGAIGKVDLTIPGTPDTSGKWFGTGNATDPIPLKGVPLDSPLVNQFGDPRLAAAAGTNLNRNATSPRMPLPTGATPAPKVIKFIKDDDGNLVPVTDATASPTP